MCIFTRLKEEEKGCQDGMGPPLLKGAGWRERRLIAFWGQGKERYIWWIWNKGPIIIVRFTSILQRSLSSEQFLHPHPLPPLHTASYQ